MKNYCCGNEFRVNDNGAFYPGYARLEDLRSIAMEVLKLTFYPGEPAEVLVTRTHNDLGLNWRFSLYSEEAGEQVAHLSRVYTFDLYPSWKVNALHDHWLSGNQPRTEQLDRAADHIQEIVDKQLAQMEKNYRSPVYSPFLERFFKNRYGAIILYTSAKGIMRQPKRVRRWSAIARKDAIMTRTRNIKKSKGDQERGND